MPNRLASSIQRNAVEAHFLAEQVAGESGFTAASWYNPFGDCITFTLADEAKVADRVDHVLTIYRSAVDSRPIGYQIKGVLAIIRRFGLSGLSVVREHDDGELLSVSVAFILLAASEDGPQTIQRREGYSIALDQNGPPARISSRDLVSA